MGKVRIGVSGWNYDEWKGNFYPEGLRESDRLRHAASVFETIEVNGTFYGLTDPETCRGWREAIPDQVKLAVKGSRFITHMKRMSQPETPLANFFASGILELGPNLGPFLWQLPANHRFNEERLERFLALLPGDTVEAGELAREHDHRVEDAAFGDGSRHRMRHVLEVRHESFLNEEAVAIVRNHGIALCFSHSSQWPYLEEVTADFVYVRLHGPLRLYASHYSEGELRAWARRIRAWSGDGEPDDAARITEHEPPRRRERDVYVYFDNTAHGYAPADAIKLVQLLAALGSRAFHRPGHGVCDGRRPGQRQPGRVDETSVREHPSRSGPAHARP